MLILEIGLFIAALAAVCALAWNQILTQMREHRFYRRNGGDFSIDSSIDKVRLDDRIHYSPLRLTNWQRFYIFRPLCILAMFVLAAGMIFSLL